MSNIDPDIVKDFVLESKMITRDLVDLLENIEGDFSQAEQLGEYGERVDHVAGIAKSLASMVPLTHPLHSISDYASLCKVVAFKAAQIDNNPELYNICVALLLDATETLMNWIERFATGESAADLKESLSATFLERLRWVSNQFAADIRTQQNRKTGKKMDQIEIDDLLRKLGAF